jgi:hypothetical protein
MVSASLAHAQYDEMIDVDEESHIGSPERFTVTLNLGMYQPVVGNDAFREIFGDEQGPYVGGEVHGLIYRIPYVGLIGAGVGVGWADYDGRACGTADDGSPDCDNRVDEKSSFTIYPLSFLASLRIDVLARELNIPLVFTPKIGLDAVFYRARTGSETDTSGVSIGLRWAVEFALELDFLERRAARALDEEWGINHSFLFFQLFGSTAKTQLPVGDSLAWTAGLGFVF